jgi:arylsulfatase A-like enzyme
MEPHAPYSAPGEARRHFGPDYEERRDFGGMLPELWRTGAIPREFTPEERRHLIDLYDAEIFYWDQQFARLLERLEALDLLDRTVIVVTSDHGEEFFDHGGLGHGLTLYEEVLRVPLIVIDPRRPKGLRVGPPVSTAGLFDAAVRLMGFERPPFTQVPTFQPKDGDVAGHEQVFCSTESHTSEAESRLAGMVEGDHKLVHSLLEEGSLLFDLNGDPREQQPLGESFQELKERLERQVLEWYRTTEREFPDAWQPNSEEILNRFKELGYVNGGK